MPTVPVYHRSSYYAYDTTIFVYFEPDALTLTPYRGNCYSPTSSVDLRTFNLANMEVGHAASVDSRSTHSADGDNRRLRGGSRHPLRNRGHRQLRRLRWPLLRQRLHPVRGLRQRLLPRLRRPKLRPWLQLRLHPRRCPHPCQRNHQRPWRSAAVWTLRYRNWHR